MNRATRIIAATPGIIFAISGMSHGFFEVLQGNIPTEGLFIHAIGENYQMWEHGAEPAFTIIPNYLLTGVVAMLVAAAIVVWCVGFLHTKHGASIFLLLFILLFLTGGGVAQVIFFLVTWLVATRIHKPLTGWRKWLPKSLRQTIAPLWPWTLLVGSILFLLTLTIATFGIFPGVTDADALLNVMLLSLLAGFACYLVTFVAGFAYDIENAEKSFQVGA